MLLHKRCDFRRFRLRCSKLWVSTIGVRLFSVSHCIISYTPNEDMFFFHVRCCPFRIEHALETSKRACNKYHSIPYTDEIQATYISVSNSYSGQNKEDPSQDIRLEQYSLFLFFWHSFTTGYWEIERQHDCEIGEREGGYDDEEGLGVDDLYRSYHSVKP